MTYQKSSTIFNSHKKRRDCWQKEENEHFPSIRSFIYNDDDNDLWKNIKNLKHEEKHKNQLQVGQN